MSYRTTEWQRRAACLGWIDFADWPARQQLEVCRGCPVTDPCAELGLQSTWSIEIALRGPIWGGMEPKRLADLVRQRGQKKGTCPASAAATAVAGRTRGTR
jgi:hypothetical protein